MSAFPTDDPIPLDLEPCIERFVAIARHSAPHARPTRVACKRCYFRVRHQPPMWRDFCLLGLIRRHCGAIAFASDATLWDEVDARILTL